MLVNHKKCKLKHRQHKQTTGVHTKWRQNKAICSRIFGCNLLNIHYTRTPTSTTGQQDTNVYKVILITPQHSMFFVQINRKRQFYRLIVPACHVTGGRAAQAPIYPLTQPGKCIIKKA